MKQLQTIDQIRSAIDEAMTDIADASYSLAASEIDHQWARENLGRDTPIPLEVASTILGIPVRFDRSLPPNTFELRRSVNTKPIPIEPEHVSMATYRLCVADAGALLKRAEDAEAVLRELIDQLTPTMKSEYRYSQGVQSAIIRGRELLRAVKAKEAVAG